jgi:hypothetical protein
VSEQRLASEGGVVLQQVVDVSDPIIVFAGRSTFGVDDVLFFRDGRSVYAGHGEWGGLDVDRFARHQDIRGPTVHGHTSRRTAFVADLGTELSSRTSRKDR